MAENRLCELQTLEQSFLGTTISEIRGCQLCEKISISMQTIKHQKQLNKTGVAHLSARSYGTEEKEEKLRGPE